MTSILLHGASGRMGREVARRIAASEQFCLAGRVDQSGQDGCLASLDEFHGQADVVVDFSHHAATAGLLEWAADAGVPVVLATTGHTEEELSRIESAAEHISVFKAANLSLGVAVLTELVRLAAEAFPQADIEIVETHHTRKQDAPSGTALSLAQTVRQVTGGELVFGRNGHRPRQPREIGVHALRLGSVPGTHQVYLDTGSETLTLSHEAHDRAVFADGALRAAAFIRGRAPGLYGMPDLLAAMRKEC